MLKVKITKKEFISHLISPKSDVSVQKRTKILKAVIPEMLTCLVTELPAGKTILWSYKVQKYWIKMPQLSHFCVHIF